MASTYTTGFGIEKIGTGEQAGSWGTTTNHNADILDRIASYKAVALSGTTHTLTIREASPGSGTENLQDGMYRVIKFTGALGGNNTVTIAPNTSPAWFIIENATTDSGSSGPYTVILTQGSGANITVQNGKNAIIYCDGAGSGAVVYNALADIQVGTLEVTGAAAIDGVTTHGGNVVSDTDSTDDLGTTSVRWANLFVDGITATDQITATGFTGTLDGILGSGTPAAATVTTAQINGTLTVGVDDTGYDVKLFGATSGKYMLWDESANSLIVSGTTSTVTAGTSNYIAGVNAGNSIESGGNYNVAVGDEAGTAITTGDYNTSVGYAALDATSTGSKNTAIGQGALSANTTADDNTAVGNSSMGSNTTGTLNVAMGHSALYANTEGDGNVAIGGYTLDANTTADGNTAVGYQALTTNTTGPANTAMGYHALYANTTGGYNTAFSWQTLTANTTGVSNTAVGYLAMLANTTGGYNTAIGQSSLDACTTGSYNMAFGHGAVGSTTTANYNIGIGYNTLNANTTGAQNTAIGGYALDANTTASNNTAVGYSALGSNTTATSNTAVGFGAAAAVTTGANNTALGINALGAETDGANNTAIGTSALLVSNGGHNNTSVGYNSMSVVSTGDNNTAMGSLALDAATSGAQNVALGMASLGALTTASYITAVGYNAGTALTTGADNTIIGGEAGDAITTGASNTAVGRNALGANITAASNTAVGRNAGLLTTGGSNTFIGDTAGDANTTGSSNIVIGAAIDVSAVDNTYEIVLATSGVGKGSYSGYINPQGGAMYQGSNGTAWTATSDRRIKKDIVPNTKGLEAIVQIEPKNFYYKSDEELQEELPGAKEQLPLDKLTTSAIAQELNLVFPEAIERRGEHDIMSVNTDPIFWAMINAIKELSAKNTALESRIETLERS